MKPLVIVGAGGLGREVAWLVEDINRRKPEWNFLGFLDDGVQGKTVEGYVGGILFSVCGALIVRYFLGGDYSVLKTVGISFAVSAFAPLGDLSESLIKRAVNAKDSGRLIPGHGGLLDRVDALLFAGPIVYYWAIYIK